MKTTPIGVCLLGLVIMVTPAKAIESANYTSLLSDGQFELREYSPQIRVETEVEGSFKRAGNQAFSLLFGYISGENQAQKEIAMTSPVSQDRSEKIEMTRPVSQNQSGDGAWRVGFLVPAEYTADTVPLPTHPKVQLRSIPARTMGVIRYSGTWSEENYQEHLQSLRDWIVAQGLTVTGQPTWARYDPPFKPWFLRRNEILIPVEADPGLSDTPTNEDINPKTGTGGEVR